MADNEVSKLTWIAIVVALAASIYSIAKPQINNLTNATFDKISSVTEGIGKPDIKHTAYANNDDGSDRFSTTKPTLNLFTGTSDKPSTRTGGSWNITAIGVHKTPKVGQEYTLSVEVPESDHDVMMEVFGWNNAGERVGWSLLSTKIKSGGKAHITFTWPDPKDSGVTQLAANLAWTNDKDTGTYSYRKAKLELGSTATPYMPSSSEVKPSDQPKYIGTYTDYSETASRDPKKYTWALNPDYKA